MGILTPRSYKNLCKKMDENPITTMIWGRPLTEYLIRLGEYEKVAEYDDFIKYVYRAGDTVYSPAIVHGNPTVLKDIIEEVIENDGEIMFKLKNEDKPVFVTRIFKTEEQAWASLN